MKKLALTLISIAAIAFSTASLQAGHHEASEAQPTSVIHVVTVSWKADASDEAIKAALDGVVKLQKDYDGIERVWIKTLKAQGNRTHAFVMEFKSEQALVDYAGSEEQKEWYKVYYPVREGSTTFDITN